MQQVNLYRPIFRKQEKKFSATAMLQAGAVVLAGVLVIYGLMWWQVAELRGDVRETNKQFIASTKRLEEATQKFGPSAKSKQLEDEVVTLEKQLAARNRVQQVLARGLFSNTSGYSDFFVAFARQHVPGVWLTGFDITGAGEDMRLQGRSTDPAQVPRYMQRLSAESALAGKEFQVFVMSRPTKDEKSADAPFVEFLFRTTLPKSAGRAG